MKPQTRLDLLLVIVFFIVLAWFGFKWFFSEKGIKKALGAFMLVILSANVLSWSSYYNGLLASGVTAENNFFKGLLRLEGKQSAKSS